LEVAKILYGYLTVLARSAEAREGEPFDIRVIIPMGMGKRLGLMMSVPNREGFASAAYKRELNESELFDNKSLEILYDLANDFRLWLDKEHRGFYSAPWGEMRLEHMHYLYFKAVARKGRRRIHPYDGQARYGPPSAQSDWRARK
jgi:hypothetical protein